MSSGMSVWINTVLHFIYRKGLRPMVHRYVQGCEACQRAKPPNHKPYGLLQSLDIPEERWKRTNIDFITKLPTTEKGNDTIITFIDGLTKRSHWVATTEKTLKAKKFAYICRYTLLQILWRLRYFSFFYERGQSPKRKPGSEKEEFQLSHHVPNWYRWLRSLVEAHIAWTLSYHYDNDQKTQQPTPP
jgi:hypothetical protein